jgi:DNA-binding MarR family transcriptional regulator
MSEFLTLFMNASKAMRGAADASVRRHGLHLGQNLVLAALYQRDGQTPGEIAAQLNVTTPTVVKMTTRMGTAGLLTRRRDETDNRLVRLYLTDAGRALQGPLEADRAELAARATKGLSEAELKQLTHGLEQLLTNLRELGTRPCHETTNEGPAVQPFGA